MEPLFLLLSKGIGKSRSVHSLCSLVLKGHWSGDLLVERAKMYRCTSYHVFMYISRNILGGKEFVDMTPKTEAKKEKDIYKLDLVK